MTKHNWFKWVYLVVLITTFLELVLGTSGSDLMILATLVILVEGPLFIVMTPFFVDLILVKRWIIKLGWSWFGRIVLDASLSFIFLLGLWFLAALFGEFLRL